MCAMKRTASRLPGTVSAVKSNGRQSELDGIPGVGPKRRRELLIHFGSLAALKGASPAEIAKAPGISRKLAEEVYGALHGD